MFDTNSNKYKSWKYRDNNKEKFVNAGTGPYGAKYGGFKPGVLNGPLPTTKRGKAKSKVKE